MKKIALAVASAALIFSMVSCASKKADDGLGAPEGLDIFAEEEGVTWEETNVKLTNNSCNTLKADTGVGVTIVVEKDVSKVAGAVDVKGASVEVVKFLGEECLKVTPNYNPEIRIAFVFDEPITTEQFSHIKFACAGFDGGAGAYNCGLMYTDPNGTEYAASFYMTDISSKEWLECNADLVADENWGKNYKADRKVKAIQFWSGDKGPLFIKGLSLVK